jgi:hypothetical protein
VAPPPPDNKLTPAVIAKAPDSVPALPDGIPPIPDDHPIWDLVRDLQVENGDLQADNERLKGESDPAIVKARLLKPFANRVFWYLVLYTAVVFAMIGLHGFKAWGFALPDTVLAVLAGTSFVAVAGLIGTIVTGLFSSK